MKVETLNIEPNGKIEGSGRDQAGEFTFKGQVLVEIDFTFKAVKEYSETDRTFFFGYCNKERTELTGHWGQTYNADHGEFRLAQKEKK